MIQIWLLELLFKRYRRLEVKTMWKAIEFRELRLIYFLYLSTLWILIDLDLNEVI